MPWVRAHPDDLFQFPQSHRVRARLMLQGPPSRKRISSQEGRAVGARGREPPSLSCPEPPNRCYLLLTMLTDMDVDTDLCSRPCRRLRRRPKDSLVLVQCSVVPRGHRLHFCVLHGQALGWGGMPQLPSFVLRMTFPAPPVRPTSLPSVREHGGQPAPGTTFVSALLPPSPAPLGFPQTPVCHAKGIPEIK